MTTQQTPLPAWCKHVVSNPDRFVIIDSETTDLRGEVCDLAIVDPAGKILFNELLRPKCPIEEGAMAIHGITDSMVAKARTFAEEFPEIEAALKGRVIIAYNVQFDLGRIDHTANVHGVSLPYMEWRCLMRMYAEYYAEPNRYGRSGPAWQKLEAACRQQGILLKQSHRALGDALATAALIRRLAELGDEAARWSSETLEEV